MWRSNGAAQEVSNVKRVRGVIVKSLTRLLSWPGFFLKKPDFLNILFLFFFAKENVVDVLKGKSEATYKFKISVHEGSLHFDEILRMNIGARNWRLYDGHRSRFLIGRWHYRSRYHTHRGACANYEKERGIQFPLLNYRTQNASRDLIYPLKFDSADAVGCSQNVSVLPGSWEWVGPRLTPETLGREAHRRLRVSQHLSFRNDRETTDDTCSYCWNHLTFGALLITKVINLFQ